MLKERGGDITGLNCGDWSISSQNKCFHSHPGSSSQASPNVTCLGFSCLIYKVGLLIVPTL